MTRFKLAPWQLSLVAAVYIVAANNGVLFSALAGSLDLASADGIFFLLMLTGLMTFVLNTIFLLFGVGRLLKPLLCVFFVGSAVFSYFSNEMGVVFDKQMFLNMAETFTDRNSAEALELASLPLFASVFFHGVVPSLLLAAVEVVPGRLVREVAVRALVTVTGCAILTGIALTNYRYITFFAVEHKALEYKVMPIYPLVSLVQAAGRKWDRKPPFHVLDADASRFVVPHKRSIGIMVVGETARVDHFSLGSYGKKTNPELERLPGVKFVPAHACGTSTLFSVPCMFSLKGRADYDPDDAARESNVLDVLTAAGVKTIWVDNNSSCKRVCNRIENVNLHLDLDESSPYYSDMGYFDEILLEKIDEYLDADGPDLLLVLHTLGSHGPAYSHRYPNRFGVFTPYCNQASPTECSPEEVANAYDNTIVYTDFVLDHLIEKLRARSDDFDSFLFYASDHGESLGENGVYLHGLPYAIAPESQTEVPMIVWISPGFQKRHYIDGDSIDRLGQETLSHDNISHTLLGLFDVVADSYDQDLDMFSHTSFSMGRNDGP